MDEIVIVKGEEVSVEINGDEVEVICYEDNYILVECEYMDIKDLVVDKIPEELRIQVRDSNGFETFLFYEAEISVNSKEAFVEYKCHEYNKYWEGKWGLSSFLSTVRDEVPNFENIEVVDFNLEDAWKHFVLRIRYSNKNVSIEKCVSETSTLIKALIRQAEIKLDGFEWEDDYETNESLFCINVLHPLLRRMDFISVRYTHGNKEYGKDFTFSEQTTFGILRHYGLQAKAGNIRGGVNSDIDELIGQVNDAFSMPYHEISANEDRYITTFIIAISGYFTENAKDKISQKIPKGLIGSVLFLDKDSIFELIEKYWTNVGVKK